MLPWHKQLEKSRFSRSHNRKPPKDLSIEGKAERSHAKKSWRKWMKMAVQAWSGFCMFLWHKIWWFFRCSDRVNSTNKHNLKNMRTVHLCHQGSSMKAPSPFSCFFGKVLGLLEWVRIATGVFLLGLTCLSMLLFVAIENNHSRITTAV